MIINYRSSAEAFQKKRTASSLTNLIKVVLVSDIDLTLSSLYDLDEDDLANLIKEDNKNYNEFIEDLEKIKKGSFFNDKKPANFCAVFKKSSTKEIIKVVFFYAPNDILAELYILQNLKDSGLFKSFTATSSFFHISNTDFVEPVTIKEITKMFGLKDSVLYNFSKISINHKAFIAAVQSIGKQKLTELSLRFKED